MLADPTGLEQMEKQFLVAYTSGWQKGNKLEAPSLSADKKISLFVYFHSYGLRGRFLIKHISKGWLSSSPGTGEVSGCCLSPLSALPQLTIASDEETWVHVQCTYFCDCHQRTHLPIAWHWWLVGFVFLNSTGGVANKEMVFDWPRLGSMQREPNETLTSQSSPEGPVFVYLKCYYPKVWLHIILDLLRLNHKN